MHFELYENVTSPAEDFTHAKGDAEAICTRLGQAFSLRFPDGHIQLYAVFDDGSERCATWGADDRTWLCLHAEDCDAVLSLLSAALSAEHPASTSRMS